jgi:UDP-N-acetylmuramoyl-tripeptide--D-alanyl-D-alanine ligase
MVRMSLSEAGRWLAADLVGEDAVFEGVGTDTRSLSPGELFIALRGEHRDGHDFVPDAQARGAAGALVSREVTTALPCLRVTDTRHALTQLARAWRAHFSLPVVAVTGSNGKTTVKEMIATILDGVEPVLATRGNLNNDLGVPLTLLRLGAQHRYAVIEMGANHPGEITGLAALARPDVAVITNAGPAHLEGFGDLDGVARAKGEILQGLADKGAAVINADDPFCDLWVRLAGGHRIVTFGLVSPADVMGSSIDLSDQGARFRLSTPAGAGDIALSLVGRHNVMNALAATAAAFALGIALKVIGEGLARTAPAKGRFQLRRSANGARLIDDTYNANPASLLSGMQALAALPGERVLVLGEMAELGESAARWHAEIGAKAREIGITRLFATGRLGELAVRSFGEGGAYVSDHQALIRTLKQEVLPDMTLLVKGSRCMRMEQVIEALSIEDDHGRQRVACGT